jgi:archaemetzincin
MLAGVKRPGISLLVAAAVVAALTAVAWRLARREAPPLREADAAARPLAPPASLTGEVVIPEPPLSGPAIAAPRIESESALALAARALAIRVEPLPEPFERLRAHAKPKSAPGAADWLAHHEERGQSFAEFRAAHSLLPGRRIHLTTAGRLDPRHREVVNALAPLLAAFFQLDVVWQEPIPDDVASAKAREWTEGRQWLTHTLMDALEARRPKDSVALMAITAIDLYPDPSWNFVYGQARYAARVGVMSLARDGEPGDERALLQRRAFATASHEIGHMLGIRHCIAWECALNGSNHRAEADARPLEPCPACLAKLQLAIGFDPERRWRELARRYAGAGLGADALAVTTALRTVQAARLPER